MRKIYLHIGLSKTGSTFLQKEIFPILRSVQYIEKPKSDLVAGEYPWDGILNRFFQGSPAVWRDLDRELFTELFGGTDQLVAGGGDVLISDENVCDHAGPVLAGKHLSEFVDLLVERGFDRVRILCSVRQQATRLASGYAQVSDRCVGASQFDFEEDTRRRIGAGYYKEGIHFDYDLLRQKLVEVVGEENVLMLPYELMKEDLRDFLGRWFDFLGRPREGGQIIERLEESDAKARNVRSSSEKTWGLRDRTLRGANTIRLRPVGVFARLGFPTEIALRWPDFEREDDIRLTPQLEQEIMSTYEESNRAFAKAIDMDLSRYNYY
jgi:hypothetical protein